MEMWFACLFACALILIPPHVSAECIADSAIDAEFASFAGVSSIPSPGSCCQLDVCAIPCPATMPQPHVGFAVAVGLAILVFMCIGVVCYFFIGGKAENFFVAGRSLPLFVVTLTLSSQSIDSNALLGNIDFSYKYHFWDGCCLPVGLGLSLVLNAVLLARHINEAKVMTLPDIYGRYYGRVVEVIISIISCISFLFLLAGNLVGMSEIIEYTFSLDQTVGIFLSGLVIVLYTVTGGLFSVAYTDVVQAFVSIVGILTFVIYVLSTEEYLFPPPSVGVPGYIYPDDATCDMYNGTACEVDSSQCCYNPAADESIAADNMAYPFGDAQVFDNQMTDAHALTPFPNAVVFNWATIFVLALGNLGALDFQARNMAAKNGKHATIANAVAGCLTFLVGIPCSYLGAVTRVHYGPDSPYAAFEADTCSRILDLPQCAMWVPEPNAFMHYLTNNVPAFLGAWCMVAIVAASMSTSDGAILAISTVVTRNVLNIKQDKTASVGIPSASVELQPPSGEAQPPSVDSSSASPDDPTAVGQTDSYATTVAPAGNVSSSAWMKVVAFFKDNLLRTARFLIIPFTIIACLIAALAKSQHSLGATGYLLIVAFDIMLAGAIVPLIAAFYVSDVRPSTALFCIVFGCLTRIILEFSLPKDGFVLFPFDGDEFLDYGSVSTSLFPNFLDVDPADKWDPETCDQRRLEDYTGIDSLVSPVVSLFVFIIVHFVNKRSDCLKRLDDHPWMKPVTA